MVLPFVKSHQFWARVPVRFSSINICFTFCLMWRGNDFREFENWISRITTNFQLNYWIFDARRSVCTFYYKTLHNKLPDSFGSCTHIFFDISVIVSRQISGYISCHEESNAVGKCACIVICRFVASKHALLSPLFYLYQSVIVDLTLTLWP